MSRHANLRLTAKLVALVAPFMAKNDIRYYLNAINVRPHKDGGAVLAATNGHIFGAIYDEAAVCDEEVILRVDARMAQACLGGLSNGREVVMIGERLAIVENGATEVYIQAGRPEVEAKYPRYENVIPKQESLKPGLVGTFGAPLISLAERAASIAAKIGSNKLRGYSGLQFFSVNGDANASAVFRLGAEPGFVGVMMPMRDDSLKLALPTWVASLRATDDLAEMAEGATPVGEEVSA